MKSAIISRQRSRNEIMSLHLFSRKEEKIKQKAKFPSYKKLNAFLSSLKLRLGRS